VPKIVRKSKEKVMESLTSIKKQIRNFLVVGLGILGLTCAINAQAGVIAFPVGVGGPGFGDEDPLDNFELSGAEDILEVYKNFNAVGYIDLIFAVTPDEPNGHALSNLVLIDEYIFNNTGITWTDYHLELGYASITINETDQECDAVGLGCFDYDFIARAVDDTSLYFTEYGGGEQFASVSDMPGDHPNMIWFDDGTVPSGDELSLFSDFALPDVHSEDIPELARLGELESSGYAVVLRQSPSIASAVPEPSIIALFGLGLFGIGFARLRKA
jgi:hypothetical protein